MRYVMIGGDAAGMSAAMEIVRNDEHAHITVLEKGTVYSYGQCGLPYVIDGRIASTEELIARTVEEFRTKYKIDARTGHIVERVDTAQQIVHGVTTEGQTFQVAYDKLLVATGARPVVPAFADKQLTGVYTVKTLPEMDALLVDLQQAKRAVVIGGGYIGLEVTETLKLRGLDVMLVHRGAQLMKLMPPAMGDAILVEAEKNGVDVLLNAEVSDVVGTARVEAVVIDGETYEADVVIIATGVTPNTDMLDADKLKNGALVVNAHMQTSAHNVYAAGDCAAHYHRVLQEHAYVALGTTANKQGRVAGRAMIGQDVKFAGIVGTAILKFFDLEIGTVGLSETEAKRAGIAYDVYTHTAKHHAGYYPDARPIQLHVLVEKESKKLLGLQAIGAGVDKRIDVFATALYSELTFSELLDLDLAYAPPFNGVWDPLQQLAKRHH